MAAVLPEAAARGFRLEAPFPSWPRRGVPGSVPGAEQLVRVDPDEDGTDGFFVALFVREPPAEGRAGMECGGDSAGHKAESGGGGAPEAAGQRQPEPQQAEQRVQQPRKKKSKKKKH